MLLTCRYAAPPPGTAPHRPSRRDPRYSARSLPCRGATAADGLGSPTDVGHPSEGSSTGTGSGAYGRSVGQLSADHHGAREPTLRPSSAGGPAEAGDPDRAGGLAWSSRETTTSCRARCAPSSRHFGAGARCSCRMGALVRPAPADSRGGTRPTSRPRDPDSAGGVRIEGGSRPSNRCRGPAGARRGPGTSPGSCPPASRFAGSECGAGSRRTVTFG
mgnify:CR=1 FL=1